MFPVGVSPQEIQLVVAGIVGDEAVEQPYGFFRSVFIDKAFYVWDVCHAYIFYAKVAKLVEVSCVMWLLCDLK